MEKIKDPKTKYQILQDKYIEDTSKFLADKEAKKIFDAISNGRNHYLKINRTETSEFDSEWIKRIEDCIPELETIVINPKRNTKIDGNVVPIELAKKTTSESVIHLSTHTQYIKDIDENGDVIPGKILSMSADDDICTYENRFIATLIRTLVVFIEKRYEYIVKHALLKEIEELKMKSRSVVDGSIVEIESTVKIIKPADYDGVEQQNSYKDRVIEIRDHLRFCYVSDFMKKLKTEKNVRNPIIMTNIIRKNPLYHKCYLLWKYIQGYQGAGVSFSVNDEYMDFDQKSLDEVNASLLANFLAVRAHNPSKLAYEHAKTYKPKILRTVDDEDFIFGPYFEGPLEYVRVDDEYRKATESLHEFYKVEEVYGKSKNYVAKTQRVLGRLKAEEEKYLEDERYENRAARLLQDAKNALLTRKRREYAAFEKKVKSIARKREIEERNILEEIARQEKIRDDEIIRLAREELIRKARLDFKDEQEIEKYTLVDLLKMADAKNGKEPEHIRYEDMIQDDLSINDTADEKKSNEEVSYTSNVETKTVIEEMPDQFIPTNNDVEISLNEEPTIDISKLEQDSSLQVGNLINQAKQIGAISAISNDNIDDAKINIIKSEISGEEVSNTELEQKIEDILDKETVNTDESVGNKVINAPKKRKRKKPSTKKTKKVQEPKPIELETPVIEEPIVEEAEPVIEEPIVEEPVVEETMVEEAEPVIEPTPEEVQQIEEPVVEEVKKPKKKRRRRRKKKVTTKKKAEENVETPAIEETKENAVEEIISDDSSKEEVTIIEPVVEEIPVETPIEEEKPIEYHPHKKSSKKVNRKKKAQKVEPDHSPIIPGRLSNGNKKFSASRKKQKRKH